MKIKKYIGLAVLMTLMITSSSLSISNANNLEAEKNNISISENSKKCLRPHKRGIKAFDKSIKELKDSGVLNDEDLRKIEEYNKSLEEQRKEEIKKKRHEKIDSMVNENVISHQKGEKLKQAIDKNIEESF